MESWRLLDLEYSDPYLNMAVEEAILLAVDKGLASNTIRLWRNPRSVVVGCFQNTFHEVNFRTCMNYGITIVRRFTGGGTVYHDKGNLNWTIVANKIHPLVPRMPAEIFKVTSSAIVEGIKLLELSAQFEPPNVIKIEGKKISGLAAYIKKNAVLCHGTLLVNTDLNILSEALNAGHNFSAQALSHLRSSRTEVTTLQRELHKRISTSAIKKLILHGFEKLYGIIAIPGKLNNDEEEIAQMLYHEKYVKKEWNFGGKVSRQRN